MKTSSNISDVEILKNVNSGIKYYKYIQFATSMILIVLIIPIWIMLFLLQKYFAFGLTTPFIIFAIGFNLWCLTIGDDQFKNINGWG